jgi:hypothetical protein
MKSRKAASPRLGYSIDEWCAGYDICRASYYNRRKDGSAPRTIKIGGRVIITVEADEEWRREREMAAVATAGGAPALEAALNRRGKLRAEAADATS